MELCAAFGAAARAAPQDGGWACAAEAGSPDAPVPVAWAVLAGAAVPPGGARPARPPLEALSGGAEWAAAGVLARLAGLPEHAAGRGVDGWGWARANLPAPDGEQMPGVPLAALSGAQAMLSEDAAAFVAGVEGESLVAAAAPRRVLAADAGMAAWLAVGAACAGRRSTVELPPGSATDAAGRWCAADGLPVLFLNVLGPEARHAMPAGAWRKARLAAEERGEPLRLEVCAHSLSVLSSGPAPEPAPPPAAPLVGAGRLSRPPGAGPVPSRRPLAALAEPRPAADFLAGGAGALASALADAASDAALRPEDLFLFSAGDALPGFSSYQVWGLGEGAVPAAAGARLADPRRKCVALAGVPRGTALGWALHAAARNADLLVVAAAADAATAATARKSFEAAGGTFYARLRPEDPAAGATLSEALRHRGLAFLQLDFSEPTAVLHDAARAPTWEEA
ncbi:hypothetical protein EPO15_15530 [bacterium]|nr:MAG: hypothetical protein EPO15_15530 [bacterium]